MLPSVYHKQACRLFCCMLHRLEERLSMSSPKSLSIEIEKESNEAGETTDPFKRA